MTSRTTAHVPPHRKSRGTRVALPSTADLVARTAINGVLHPLRAGKVLIPSALGALRHVAELPGKIAGGVAAALAPGSGSLFAPSTRFNGAADTATGV